MRVPEVQDRPAYGGLFLRDHGAAAASTRLTVLTTVTAAICGQARCGAMFTSCRPGVTPLQPMYTKGSTIFTRSTDALPTRSASAGSKMCPTHLVPNTIWDRLQSRMALFLWEQTRVIWSSSEIRVSHRPLGGAAITRPFPPPIA